MWKCDKLHSWLSELTSESPDKRYRHRLLKEDLNKRFEILEDLKFLVWQAHEDVRRHYQELIGNPLTPFEEDFQLNTFENYFDLPLNTLKEYFGETFVGLFVETFSPFNIEDWKVPTFLFKFHNAAIHRREEVRQTGQKSKNIVGRPGNDCLAFQVSQDGTIKRSLFCEAKCTAKHRINMIAKAYEQINSLLLIPQSIFEVIEVLENRKKYDHYAQSWIDALRRLWLSDRLGNLDKEYERCDLIIYLCGQSPKKQHTWLPKKSPHKNYTRNRRLEAVEIHLHDVDALILELYSSMDSEAISPHSLIKTVQPNHEVEKLAKALREELAGKFSRPTARLYSQHTKLHKGESGLRSWRPEEFLARLDDAVRLLEAAFIEQKTFQDDTWQRGVRRAGELLEWLDHAEMNPDDLPLRLLSAAAYQLAGYPARAAGILREHVREDTESRILQALLKADFQDLFQELGRYWGNPISQDIADFNLASFHNIVIKETIRALGVLCSAIRWGDEERVEQAHEKLLSVSNMLLHGNDFYSWLLAKLCTAVMATYVKGSLRHHLKEFSSGLNETGQQAFERYLRLYYCHCKTIAWPSQIRGIERLKEQTSFALCTPTGSGKTTVAELAILQNLFSIEEIDIPGLNEENFNFPDFFPDIFFNEQPIDHNGFVPLVLYLTPTRALAAEVEDKLFHALGHLSTGDPIVVTGLYGGTDWGPTDVWLTEGKPTVLICTYEKAEALIRFLGPLFRQRISLVIIDEAHSVDFGFKQDDPQEELNLQRAESRALRLELLGTRLLAHLSNTHSRVIALSAVASEIEQTLADWVSGQDNAIPVKSPYRSTRQLIGRLECLPNRSFSIRHDLLDGMDLQFEKESEETPYIQNPFPLCPRTPDFEIKGPEKKLRPYLLWAAINLAKADKQGKYHAVLISVTKGIKGYIEDFSTLLENTWINIHIPIFFEPPTQPDKERIWEQCLKTCKDYFTDRSHEYRLLERGIIVHHGNMPGLLARLFVEAIQERIVHIVVATSTLSEGVNLPFETVLIPNLLRRSDKPLHIREFENLIGRAGRPGFGTEGSSLVLVEPKSYQEKAYLGLVKKLQQKQDRTDTPQSPLAQLLSRLHEQWCQIPGSTQISEFLTWLEKTAPLDDVLYKAHPNAIEMLDVLDSVLLSAIVEIEQLADQEDLSLNELEDQLRHIWQHSYARYAINEEQTLNFLENMFIHRGRAVKSRIYPESKQRKKLYRTSLPPRAGEELANLYPIIKQHLEIGRKYVTWKNPEQRFDYIRTIIDQLTALPKFRLSDKKKWQNVLRWWFKMEWGTDYPSPKRISEWYKYVNQNFIYRFNWGLGSLIALAIEETHQDILPTLENWPQTGLPWIVFWLKELVTWGTLEPVAAYLLARRIEITRTDAEKTAQKYYEEQPEIQNPDEFLNAVTIRKWAQQLLNHEKGKDDVSSESKFPSYIPVKLLANFQNTPKDEWRVVPVETDTKLYWYDSAGYPLAESGKLEGWQAEYLNTHDFILDISQKAILSVPYL